MDCQERKPVPRHRSKEVLPIEEFVKEVKEVADQAPQAPRPSPPDGGRMSVVRKRLMSRIRKRKRSGS